MVFQHRHHKVGRRVLRAHARLETKLDGAAVQTSKHTVAMMGYGLEDENTVLELTYNYEVKEYDKGNTHAQIAIGTNDVYKTADAIKLNGGNVLCEPSPLPGINTKITTCVDPDG